MTDNLYTITFYLSSGGNVRLEECGEGLKNGLKDWYNKNDTKALEIIINKTTGRTKLFKREHIMFIDIDIITRGNSNDCV